jgi:bifunctional non-homologous end joining protein LigD
MAKSKIQAMDADEFFAQKSARGNAFVSAAGDVVPLTNLHKVYWPEEGYTKFDLLKYYYTVFKTILPYIKDRPLILKRYPNGIEGELFYQHNLSDVPTWVNTYSLEYESGRIANYAVARDLADILYVVNLGTITMNPFFATVDHLKYPDFFAFDLDPMDNATFEQVKKIAREVKKLLDAIGLKGYPKTSGSSGIHIYVPVKPDYTFTEIVDFAKTFATLIAERNPDDATVERMVKNRKQTQVYVDYLQNVYGKSLAAPYSVREKPHAMVSAPLEWKEITKSLTLEKFTIKTMPRRLKTKGDLFTDVMKKKQSLTQAWKKLEKLRAG